MNTEHIVLYWSLRVEVYTGVALFSVSHIAEFMLERWWIAAGEAYRCEVNEVVKSTWDAINHHD